MCVMGGARKPYIPEFGEYLEKTRKRKKLTQDEFAERLGVTQQTVSRWEGGDLPPLPALTRIAQVLGVSPESLAKFQPRTPVLITDALAEMGEYIRMFQNRLDGVDGRLKAMEARLDEAMDLLRRR